MEKIDNKYEVGDWLIYPKHGLGKAIDYDCLLYTSPSPRD